MEVRLTRLEPVLMIVQNTLARHPNAPRDGG